MRTAAQITLVIGLLLTAINPAWANVQYLQAAKKTYPKAKVSCTMCHTGPAGNHTNLNEYAKTLQALKTTDGHTPTPEEALKQLDADDLDQDGATNGEELVAGTDPNDARSTPPETKAPTTP